MRHRKSFNHLSRKKGHRDAMLANMASSLIKHKRIKTTLAKAKALRMYVEPLITKSKNDTTHSRRVVYSYLSDKYAVSELFREVSAKITDRPGGYTRIIKLGNRFGDNAEMCIIELVDYNETMLAAKTETKQKSTRRRRGSKKKSKPQEEQNLTSAQADKTDSDVNKDQTVEGEASEKQVTQEESSGNVEEQTEQKDTEEANVEVKEKKEKAEATGQEGTEDKEDKGSEELSKDDKEEKSE